MWKLTDFGISGPALTDGVPTALSRGTPCYRAPELYQEKPKYTDKVDIWALGCILFECFTGSKAFVNDSAVELYSEDNAPIVAMPWPTEIWHNLVEGIIHDLLSKDEAERPLAGTVFDQLASYQRILVSPLAEVIFSCAANPSYEEWNDLRVRDLSQIDWLHELAMSYKLKGEDQVANTLLEEMVQQYLSIIEKFHASSQTAYGLSREAVLIMDENMKNPILLFKKILDYLPQWLLAWICYEMATYLISSGATDWEHALPIFKDAMNRSPGDLILPMLLSNLYAKASQYKDAMDAQTDFLYQNDENSLINFESALFGFYARIIQSKTGQLEQIMSLMDA